VGSSLDNLALSEECRCLQPRPSELGDRRTSHCLSQRSVVRPCTTNGRLGNCESRQGMNRLEQRIWIDVRPRASNRDGSRTGFHGYPSSNRRRGRGHSQRPCEVRHSRRPQSTRAGSAAKRQRVGPDCVSSAYHTGTEITTKPISIIIVGFLYRKLIAARPAVSNGLGDTDFLSSTVHSVRPIQSSAATACRLSVASASRYVASGWLVRGLPKHEIGGKAGRLILFPSS
jgi:hypothetical protein